MYASTSLANSVQGGELAFPENFLIGFFQWVISDIARGRLDMLRWVLSPEFDDWAWAWNLSPEPLRERFLPLWCTNVRKREVCPCTLEEALGT